MTSVNHAESASLEGAYEAAYLIRHRIAVLFISSCRRKAILRKL